MQEAWVHPWVWKIPWSRKWQPTPAFLPGESHGQKSLAGYSPWGRRVRHDWATERTHTHRHIFIIRTFHRRYHNPHFTERNEFRKVKWCAQWLQCSREGQFCELNASTPRSMFPLSQHSDLPTNSLFLRDSSHSSWPHPVLQPFVIPPILPSVFIAPFPAPSSQFHMHRWPCLGS